MRKRLNEPDRHPTIDHIIPLCGGGPDTFENTVAACSACNGAKGSLPPEDFQASAFLKARKQIANTPPDRLSVAIGNKYYDRDALRRGLTILFNNRELSNVEEYCLSEGWVAVPVGKLKQKRDARLQSRNTERSLSSTETTYIITRMDELSSGKRRLNPHRLPPTVSHRMRSHPINLHE